jgi:hypothetical protein
MKKKIVVAMMAALPVTALAQRKPRQTQPAPMATTPSTTAAAAGQVLTWNGSAWIPSSVPPLTMTGDVTGSTSGNKVGALLGRALNTTAPTTGQTLTYDGTQWSPVTPSGGGGGGTVSMAGDVTGTNAVSSVVALRGHPISTATPTASYALVFDGTNWSPALPNPTMAGDVTGTANGNVVSSLRTVPLSATVPTSGQVLTFNGTQWGPTGGTGQSLVAAGTITVSNSTTAVHNFPTALPPGAVCQVVPQFDPSSLPSLTWYSSNTTTSVTVNLSTAGSGTFNFMCAASFN